MTKIFFPIFDKLSFDILTPYPLFFYFLHLLHRFFLQEGVTSSSTLFLHPSLSRGHGPKRLSALVFVSGSLYFLSVFLNVLVLFRLSLSLCLYVLFFYFSLSLCLSIFSLYFSLPFFFYIFLVFVYISLEFEFVSLSFFFECFCFCFCLCLYLPLPYFTYLAIFFYSNYNLYQCLSFLLCFLCLYLFISTFTLHYSTLLHFLSLSFPLSLLCLGLIAICI